MAPVEVFAQPDVVIAATARVGEGPVWDRRSRRLCWVDIPNGTLFATEVSTGDQQVWRVPTMLGAAAPRAAESGFAVAVAEGFGLLDGYGRLEILDPVLPEPERRMNDAKCDSQGRLWAGSTHLDFRPGGGALHRWDGREPSTVLADGFALPNGLGWSPDDRLMYLADSMSQQVLVAGFDAADGLVGQFTPLCRIPAGLPDGLAVDLDGCLWVAVWGGQEIRRYDGSGTLVGRVPMPVTQPSSCAFGDGGVLYITSARDGLSEDELTHQPHAGSVFALATRTEGVPVGPFRA